MIAKPITLSKLTGKQVKLTRKQQRFVEFILNNPKASATEAAMQTYNVANRDVAKSVAAENLAKPNILAILANHDLQAQKALSEGLKATKGLYHDGEMVAEEPDHTVRLRAADSILDRLHGKATQRIEQHTSVVTLNLSLADVASQPVEGELIQDASNQ